MSGSTLSFDAAFRSILPAFHDGSVYSWIVEWQMEEHLTEHEAVRLARGYLDKDTTSPRFA